MTSKLAGGAGRRACTGGFGKCACYSGLCVRARSILCGLGVYKFFCGITGLGRLSVGRTTGLLSMDATFFAIKVILYGVELGLGGVLRE